MLDNSDVYTAHNLFIIIIYNNNVDEANVLM